MLRARRLMHIQIATHLDHEGLHARIPAEEKIRHKGPAERPIHPDRETAAPEIIDGELAQFGRGVRPLRAEADFRRRTEIHLRRQGLGRKSVRIDQQATPEAIQPHTRRRVEPRMMRLIESSQ